MRACVWFGKCALAYVNVRQGARVGVCGLLPPPPPQAPLCLSCMCLACAATAAASLAPPAPLAPSFSFAPHVSPAWRSRCRCRLRCMHHLRRSWPESLSLLALSALLVPLAPLEPLAELMFRGSVVCLHTSNTLIVPLERASACACACVLACVRVRARGGGCRARACVRACARAWGVCVALRAGGPGAIGQAAGPGRQLWSRLPRARCLLPRCQLSRC